MAALVDAYGIDEARADDRRRGVRRRPAPARARSRASRGPCGPPSCRRRATSRRPRARLPPRELLTTLHVARRARRRRGADPVGPAPAPEPPARRPPRPRLRSPPPTAAARSSCRRVAAPAALPRRRVADVWPFSEGPCLRRSLVAGHLLRDVDAAGAPRRRRHRRRGPCPRLARDRRPAARGRRHYAVLTLDAEVARRVTSALRATARIYDQCGLRLRSEIELHLPPADSERWDVDVSGATSSPTPRRPPPGEVIAELDSRRRAGGTRRRRPAPGTCCASATAASSSSRPTSTPSRCGRRRPSRSTSCRSSWRAR